MLADDIGGDYLELALESASSKLDGQDRVEPDLAILGQIHQVDLALHLWQTYYSTVLVPLVSSSPAVRRDALRWNANTVTRVEGKVNKLVLRFLDGKSLDQQTSHDIPYGLLLPCSFGVLVISLAKKAEEQRFQTERRGNVICAHNDRTMHALLQFPGASQ